MSSVENIVIDLSTGTARAPLAASVTVDVAAVVNMGTGGGGGGVSDHGALSGLSDDDHPHYLNTDRAQAAHFSITARFAELDTAQAKADARAALELNIIDCGTF